MQHVRTRRDGRLHVYAVGIYGNVRATRTVQLIRFGYLAVAGIFDGVRSVASDELDYCAVELLGARADDNIARVHHYSARAV